MAKRDYYDILGVRREATADEIKRSYRKLARNYHPDLHPGDKQAEAKFKELQEAYDVIGDADKRGQYDRFGSAAFEQGGPGPRSRTYSWSGQGGPSEGAGFAGFEDVLGGLFGGRGAKGGGRFAEFPGEDIEAEISIPFRVAVLGGDIDVELSGPTRKKLSIKIPPEVADGARLRLAGKGAAGSAGGRPGDLYVHVQVQPHPYFTRKGADLYVEVPITIAEASLGATIDVPTLDGALTVDVPAGASSGQKLRLRGKGGSTKAGGKGDQYVQVKIVVPKSLDEESERLLREFAERNPMNPRQGLGW